MNKLEEAIREDFIEEDQDEMHEEYKHALVSLGLPEDEAEMQLEDMGL